MKKIELNVPYDKAGIEKQPYQPRLDAYLLDSAHVPMKRPAVIVCPGGGYAFTSEREGEPVALQYAAAGCQAFVLWYSVAPDVWPTALLELAASVAYVRSHASEWDIDRRMGSWWRDFPPAVIWPLLWPHFGTRNLSGSPWGWRRRR